MSLALLSPAALMTGCGEPEPDCDAVGVICTVAGTGQVGFNGLDLPATESWLSYPSAVEGTPSGALLVVDYNNFVLRLLEGDGALATLAGTNVHAWAVEGPALDSPMENPIDADVDEAGRVWIAEQHTGRVLLVEDGALSVAAGSGEYGFEGDGGDALAATFSYLGGVQAVAEGLLISDTDNHALRFVDREGQVSALAGDGAAGFEDGAAATLNRPQRMHADGRRVLLADSGNHALRAWDLDTQEMSTLVGDGVAGLSGDGGPAVDARLNTPGGVAVDADGRVYIADTFNNVIRVIEDGVIRTLAGTGEAGYAGDGGDAALATLSWPADVSVHEGALYIADMRNSVVRRVVLP